jgi:hypothetical protein
MKQVLFPYLKWTSRLSQGFLLVTVIAVLSCIPHFSHCADCQRNPLTRVLFVFLHSEIKGQ